MWTQRWAGGAVKLDVTYTTPVETHNPMEMHATIASWTKDKLTLYETSQGVVNHRNCAAEILAIPLESVEVISRFIGSGFGSKLFPWPHSWMAALASKQLGRPVKVSVPRTHDVHHSGPSPVYAAAHPAGGRNEWEAHGFSARNISAYFDG